MPFGQSHRYETRWVEKAGTKWYTKHNEIEYAPGEFINKESLQRELPSIVRRLEELHMNFLFEQPTQCNLYLIREFYAN